MLTSAKIGKQNGDTRTRKTEPGYLNLSNDCRLPTAQEPIKMLHFVDGLPCHIIHLFNSYIVKTHISKENRVYTKILL
jgi:hypothetical protein